MITFHDWIGDQKKLLTEFERKRMACTVLR